MLYKKGTWTLYISLFYALGMFYSSGEGKRGLTAYAGLGWMFANAVCVPVLARLLGSTGAASKLVAFGLFVHALVHGVLVSRNMAPPEKCMVVEML